MPNLPLRFAQSVLADAHNVGPLRRACAAFAAEHGLSTARAQDLQLAVAEALNNVVTHAYRFAAQPGPMGVQITCVEGSIVVVVCDQGAGYSLRNDSPGAGIGMFLIRELADTLEVTPNPMGGRGTLVRMSFGSDGARL